MKKLLLSLTLVMSLGFALQAQIQDGTTAPEWTATDIDGQSHTLYDILNSGRHVVLEFSATWCGPCWNFHNTGTFESLWDEYGPDGSDEIHVFYVEADLGTSLECLFGPTNCTGGTQGDWVTGHDFDFINLTNTNASGMASDYSVGYYPTIYAISANHTNGVYEVGQEQNLDRWAEWLFESFEMVVTPTITNSDCGLATGEISLAIELGHGNKTVSWSNGMSGPTISNLEPGQYTATVEDENGYMVVETYEITGPPVPAMDLLSQENVDCAGNEVGSLSVLAGGGNGGWSYEWSNGETTSSIEDLAAGTYEVIATDALNCETVETYEITEPEELVLETEITEPDCLDGLGAVQGLQSGGVGPYTYEVNGNTNSSGYFDVGTGDYDMIITDGNNCTTTMPFSIGELEDVEAIAEQTGNDISCVTPTSEVSGIGSSEGENVDYEWITADGEIESGVNDLVATVSAPGTYTLYVFNEQNNCFAEASVTVGGNMDLPDVMIEDPEAIDCQNGSVELDGTGSESGSHISYTWSTEDGEIDGDTDQNTATASAPGTYTLSVFDNINGCESTMSVTVDSDGDLPEIAVEDGTIDCTADVITICADVDAGVSVTWDTPDGEMTGNCIEVSQAGEYIATAEADNGCSQSATSIVDMSMNAPEVDIEEPLEVTCLQELVTVSSEIEGDLSDFTILWTTEDGNIVGDATGTDIEVDAGGTYSISVLNEVNGCETTLEVTVEENIEFPESAFDFEVIDGVVQVNSTSSGNPSEFNWNFGASGEEAEVSFDENGEFEICLTVLNDCGEDTECQTVDYAPELLFEATEADLDCHAGADGRLEVEPSGGRPEYTIEWTGPNGFTSDQFVIENLEAGTYTMILRDEFGYEKTESYEVTEPAPITEQRVDITDETSEDGGSIELIVEGGTGEYMYKWSNGETTSLIDGLPAGDYTCEVTDENGCVQTFGPYTVGFSTAVSDLDVVKDFEYFPVPANAELNVRITLNRVIDTQLRVLSPEGTVMVQRDYQQNVINDKIDITDLASGMYLLEYGTATDRQVEKLIVIK